MRHINQAGIDLIKRFEGLDLRAYRCPAGIWTIGYGHTGNVKPKQIITQAQADDLLRADLEDAERAVETRASVRLNDNEFGALVSLVFNIGAGAFRQSTLLRKLNAGDRIGAAAEFKRWNKADGHVLDGLTQRRIAEAALFRAAPVEDQP